MRLFKQSHFLKNMVSLNVNNNNNNLFIPLPIKSMRIPSQKKIITKPSPPVLKNANVSSYRLGDLILLNISEHEKNELSTDYPNSIGSKYLVEKNKNKKKNDYTTNIDIVTKIVLEFIEKNIEYLPKDIENSTVIHLRLGDVKDRADYDGSICADFMRDKIENGIIPNNDVLSLTEPSPW